jgi:hypothetical protein
MNENEELIKAVMRWYDEFCDVEDHIEKDSGCDCEICNLARAVENYKQKRL